MDELIDKDKELAVQKLVDRNIAMVLTETWLSIDRLSFDSHRTFEAMAPNGGSAKKKRRGGSADAVDCTLPGDRNSF